jgi:Holliday junction resolvase RusA-like endonuclease
MIRITLDYPPSSNRYWRIGNGKIHRSTEANSYRAYVHLLCNTAGFDPLDGDLCVTMRFYRPQRSGDLDNRFKQVLDALQGKAYHNDAQIAEIHATRHEDKHAPRVEIFIKPIGDAA